MRVPSMTRFLGLAIASGLATVPQAFGGNACPPPPNTACPVQVHRITLTEQDVDDNGQPDNAGSTGSFCGGDSPANCSGIPAAEVGYTLILPSPSRQTVRCTIPNAEVWIMDAECGSCLARGVGSATLPANTTASTTLKVVVSDTNGDICPCGPLLTCTYSVETFCNDGSDGDGDGLIDSADPDCCSSPSEVNGPTLTRIGNATTISWDSQPGTVVDIVSGRIRQVRDSGGFGSASCLVEDHAGSSVQDPNPPPSLYVCFYYLLRAQSSCGDSTYGDSTLHPDPRDALDAGPCD